MQLAGYRARASWSAAFALLFLGSLPAHADTITLTWDPNVEQVAGYYVYSGTQPGSLPQRYDVGNSTTFTMPNAAAGQQYCFAVSAYLDTSVEGPKSTEVCGYTNRFPSLANPGNPASTVGQAAALQLSGSDPDGQPVSYSAAGLPPGLSLMSTTGFISGTPATAGSYAVTASVSDGVLSSAPQSFTWSVSPAATVDTTPPSVTITSPTSGSAYTSGAATLALGGGAGDDLGVSTVTWASDRGGSGTAVGTATWSVAGVGLQVGTNVVTVTAVDAAGNRGTDVLTVTYVPPDSTAPAISITSPTSSAAMNTTASTLKVAGTASDNVGVTAVSWANDRGGSGTASGTSSWQTPLIPLQGGTNVITVTAHDAAGNRNTDVLTVSYAAPDTTAPVITILGPTSSPTYTSTTSVVTLGGTASDDLGVTAVTWSNDRGGAGFSSGTTSWSIPSIALQSGTNVITVKAQDAAGNASADVLTVTYSTSTPEVSSITLSGSFYAARRWSKVYLRWTIVKGRSIDVYRDGIRIAKTSNDGSYTDAPRGEGPFNYRVCITGSGVCSNTVLVAK